MEIRLHGRGGQGGVTCAKIVAATYARLGKYVQTFGDYAGERSGAPVRAYTRVSDAPILNRNKVYRPDHLLVLDPHLMGAAVVEGLAPGGVLLVNAPHEPDDPEGLWAPFRLATVDATAIARRHGIGTRTVVIVNTTIAGAFARLLDIPLEVLEAAYRSLGFLSNFPAAREAWKAVRVREPLVEADAVSAAASSRAPAAAAVEPLPEHVESPPSQLRTGSWSSQRPRYVEHLAPCNAWCPAGNDVVGFVQTLESAGPEAAAAVLAPTTPFAGTCGRVCPAPCMEGCNRAEYDGSVRIRGLERWIADRAPRPTEPDADGPRGAGSVAIVGGGPAGLSAAYALARAGVRSTIFEAEPELGGVLVTGIPAYRLPREVVRREVEAVLALGVEARCEERLDPTRVRALADEHDAVILATGLQRLRALDVPGTDLAGVEQGIRFLHRVNRGDDVRLAGHVVVLGGGNTALDCARSALRLGAERVTIVYRRTRAEMPAIDEEIEQAESEGCALRFLSAPVGFEGPAAKGRVRAVRLAEVELGEPDETGRRRPRVTERTRTLACDAVLLALGQSADLRLVPPEWSLHEGRLYAGAAPLPVFAAGDLATGDGTVAHAIGSGRRAAGLALRALGAEVDPFERPDRTRAVPATDIRFDHFERRAATLEQLVPEDLRLHGFDEVDLGPPSSAEVHRCFSCGHCTQCDTCLVYCPEGIIRRHDADYELDYTYCKGCGICVHECPRSGMEMTTT